MSDYLLLFFGSMLMSISIGAIYAPSIRRKKFELDILKMQVELRDASFAANVQGDAAIIALNSVLANAIKYIDDISATEFSAAFNSLHVDHVQAFAAASRQKTGVVWTIVSPITLRFCVRILLYHILECPTGLGLILAGSCLMGLSNVRRQFKTKVLNAANELEFFVAAPAGSATFMGMVIRGHGHGKETSCQPNTRP